MVARVVHLLDAGASGEKNREESWKNVGGGKEEVLEEKRNFEVDIVDP